MADVVFEVVGRAKTEKLSKGKRTILYRVSLKSVDGADRLSLTDQNPDFLQLYPFGSAITVKIGNSPQTTLKKAVTEET